MSSPIFPLFWPDRLDSKNRIVSLVSWLAGLVWLCPADAASSSECESNIGSGQRRQEVRRGEAQHAGWPLFHRLKWSTTQVKQQEKDQCPKPLSNSE